jgi:hypothetical protein
MLLHPGNPRIELIEASLSFDKERRDADSRFLPNVKFVAALLAGPYLPSVLDTPRV